MKKSNSHSIMERYSSARPSRRKTNEADMPLMTTYEQRYKGPSMSRELTAPKPVQTLDEKIEAKSKKEEKKTNNDPMNSRVSVEIGGNHYLLGCTDDVSASRIKRIAQLANSIIEDTKTSNPGLTNSKINILALVDACDRLISATDENNSLKTEILYRDQMEIINRQNHPIEPTPMEKLAEESEASEEK